MAKSIILNLGMIGNSLKLIQTLYVFMIEILFLTNIITAKLFDSRYYYEPSGFIVTQ